MGLLEMLSLVWVWVGCRSKWLQWSQWLNIALVISWIVHATERFAAGSVYLVLLGNGDAGRLGVSWMCCGVALSSAIVTV